jgi:hypothetical protein
MRNPYYVWTSGQRTRRRQLFDAGRESEDGSLIVGDKKGRRGPFSNHTIPSKPQYVLDEEVITGRTIFPNWPKLSWAEARKFVTYMTDTEGGSDGFTRRRNR